jgi:hypothetical protein
MGAGGVPVSRFPVLPSREFNLQGRRSVAITHYHSAEVFIERRFFKSLYLEVAANVQHVARNAQQGIWRDHQIDINQVLPSGAPNPNLGKAFVDVSPSRQTQQNDIVDYRASGSYELGLGRLGAQRVSFIAGKKVEDYQNFNYRLARTNGPNPDANATTNQIVHRVYWEAPRDDLWDAPTQTGDVRIAMAHTGTTLEDNELTYLQAATNGHYWNRRIATILGLRNDGYKRTPWGSTSRNPDGTPIVTRGAGTDVSVTTSSAGAVFYPFRHVGLYANTSKTFNAPGSGNNLIDGTAPSPSNGQGLDYGLKLDVLDGKVAGSIGFFRNRNTGRLVTGPSLGDINEIWSDLGRLDQQILGGYRDTQTFESQGWEIDLTASPCKGLKILANYGRPETKQSDTLPGLRGYHAANLATWQAGAADSANPNRARIVQNLSDIQRALEAANEGRRLSSSVDYTANAYVDYSIQSGALRHLSFGAGVNVRGRTLIGNVANQPFNYLFARWATVSSFAAWGCGCSSTCRICWMRRRSSSAATAPTRGSMCPTASAIRSRASSCSRHRSISK